MAIGGRYRARFQALPLQIARQFIRCPPVQRHKGAPSAVAVGAPSSGNGPVSDPAVSIVIPTKNSASNLEACLRSITCQSYDNIAIVVVDGQSTDATLKIAAAYKCAILQFDPHAPRGTFDAPHRRNYGASHCTTEFIYCVDADMELTPTVVSDAVALCREGYDAVIVREESFGVGIWARAKALERRCYWDDDTVEAPRFVTRQAWTAVGGLDEHLGGGGDDWDLYQSLLQNGYRVGRTASLVRHNEGHLQLRRLARKRFMYGRDALRYIAKRPRAGLTSYFPIRAAYLRNWRLFAHCPVVASFFVVMRTVEYAAGAAGIIYSSVAAASRPR